MSQTFVNLRKHRRAILTEIEQQQRQDACASKELRNCILAYTETLLDQLLTLMDVCGQDRNLNREDRDLLKAVNSKVGINDLRQLYTCYTVQKKQEEMLQAEHTAAQKRFDDVSPLWLATKWFNNESENKVYEAFESARDQVSKRQISTEAGLKQLESSMQKMAKNFLSVAMTKESLQKIQRSSSPLFADVRKTLLDMSERLQDVAAAYSVTQLESFRRLNKETTLLNQTFQMHIVNQEI